MRTLPANTRVSDGLEGALKLVQRNPTPHDDVPALEAARQELEELAAGQQVRPISAFESLKAQFWPQAESVDDFVQTVRERRRV